MLETSNQRQTQNNNYQETTNTSTVEQTLTQEGKINVEILKRIRSEKKTALNSLWNQNWKTIEVETEKINDLLTNIPMKNIADLNNLIYARAKLSCEKVGLALKKKNKMATPWWEIRLKT